MNYSEILIHRIMQYDHKLKIVAKFHRIDIGTMPSAQFNSIKISEKYHQKLQIIKGKYQKLGIIQPDLFGDFDLSQKGGTTNEKR